MEKMLLREAGGIFVMIFHFINIVGTGLYRTVLFSLFRVETEYSAIDGN